MSLAPACLLPEAPADGVVACDPSAKEPCPTGFFCRIGDTSGVPKCYRTSGGGYCGDGVVDPGEECDTEYAGTETCEGRGYWAGSLTCGRDCRVKEAYCVQFRSITSGSHTTAALDSNGGIWSWGGNAAGLFGDGTLTSSEAPRRADIEGVSFGLVTLGTLHACALDTLGNPYCWGRNDLGQQGNGEVAASEEEVPVLRPTRVNLAPTLVTMAAGDLHTCGVDELGAAWCWGSNSDGQVGGSLEDVVEVPTQVSLANAFTHLTAGRNFTCGLDRQGLAYCWGANGRGQLGTGDQVARGEPTAVMDGYRFVGLSAGNDHVCGLDESGFVWCWGGDGQGQLGNGGPIAADGFRNRPTLISGSEQYLEVAAGARSTCARASNGTIRCWGVGPIGTAGPGETADPTVVATWPEATALSVGAFFACAIDSRGAPLCWGFSHDGRAGSSVDSSRPAALLGNQSFSRMAAGYAHTCGATASGEMWCWGWNNYGQAGDYILNFVPWPRRVDSLAGAEEVAANYVTTCTRLDDGSVKCWGNNVLGQVGNGSTTSVVDSPAEVAGDHVFVELSGHAYGTHFCGLDGAGAVWCWGDNAQRQLGTSTGSLSRTPIRVTLPASARQVSAGAGHSCAVLEGGDAYCWGYNVRGQLGTGSSGSAVATPARVLGSHTFEKVSAGATHTCGLDEGGLAWCWGQSYGLGTGLVLDEDRPAAVFGGQRFSKVSAGTSFTCGVGLEGSGWCWGWGLNGELGDGQRGISLIPVAVDLPSVESFFPGYDFVCARTGTGASRCWGSNHSMQLGIDSYLEAPVEVTPP
jgi:alpha-tubulin suppressor-like RCC1 family protein